MPASRMVGTSGSIGLRVAEVTASARTWPPVMNFCAPPTMSNIICNCPPMTSFIAGALEPLRVFVQTKQKVKGIAVPVASLMKNPANQTVVWVKTAPERFEPRSITTEALDGVNVAVTSGLKAGDRIATQGATLINQVR